MPRISQPPPDVGLRPAVTFWPRLLGLASGRSLAFWTVTALLLVSPSLLTGWVADDYLQLIALRERPGVEGLTQTPLDLFRFATGDRSAARELIEQGVFPWWTDLSVRLAFLRPLTSLTHVIDSWLWPGSSFLMHAHSLAWFAVLLVSVGACYRRLASSALVAGLALAFFAVDDAHAPSVGWISNRNMIIALALSTTALLHHDRWRRSGRGGCAWLAHGCFALGLAAGEAALAIVAYLVAYALFMESSSLGLRLRSLLGYLGIVLIWRAIYAHGGYGAVGSGLYVDPAIDPAEFLRLGVPRFLVLSLALFAAPWSDLWELYPVLAPTLKPALLGLACIVLAALCAAGLPALRTRPTARFWFAGCLGSFIPLCATFPHDRLLLGPSIGGAAFLAEVIEHTLSGVSLRPSRAAAASVLLVVHLLVAPVLCGFRAATVGSLDDLLRAQNSTLPSSPSVRGQTLVLLNPPLDPFAAYLSPYRELHQIPRPRALYWLATGVSELRVSALDDHTLSIRPREGYLWSSSQRMLRSPAPGRDDWSTPLELRQATFTVSKVTADGRPEEVQVRFKKDLQDRTLIFMRWAGPGYVEFTPPKPGGSVVIPAVDLLSALSG
jgi:hypothetical protein